MAKEYLDKEAPSRAASVTETGGKAGDKEAGEEAAGALRL